jgi:hypothetical protein
MREPPTRAIRAELVEVIAEGIRQHGPDAVGLLIVGLARVIVGAAALTIVLGIGTIFGFDGVAAHLAAAAR